MFWWFCYLLLISCVVRENQYTATLLSFGFWKHSNQFLFSIFLRMETLQLLWSSWQRVESPSWFFFFSIPNTVELSAACNQLLSKPDNLRIARFNSLMGDSGEDEDNRRHHPWLFPLQAEWKPLLAHPGTHPSWWFTSEVPPVNQHLSYSRKTQTGHYPPDVI